MDESLVLDEAELQRIEQEREAEAARIAEEQRRQEEQEQKRREEQLKAEQQRLAELKRREEEQRQADEARQKAIASAPGVDTSQPVDDTIDPDPATMDTHLSSIDLEDDFDDGSERPVNETVAYEMPEPVEVPEPEQDEAEPLPEQFGRYRILEPIGEGSMGAVYLAHDSELDRQIALKIPRFSDPDCEKEVERFFREARAAATLRHPNICQVFDIGEIDGHYFIAMEYIKGNPLTAFIKQPKFQPVRKIAATLRKVAKALQEAHDHNLVHRDLKPDNIMIDERGEPTIMDFGLVRIMDDNDRLTTSGAIVGSPAYMSPEQVDGKAEDVGPHSDIFSLGTITYELLTRRRPFRGSLSTIFDQIANTDPLPPSKLRPDVDHAFEKICQTMMAKQVADRYLSMNALADALAEYIKDPSISAVAGQSATPSATPATPQAAATGPDEAAAHWILQIGGILKVATNESKSVAVPDINSLPAPPYQVVDVALVKNDAVTDQGLSHLSSLRHLLVLRLSETSITDAGLACLSGLNNLPVLDLSYTNVTDAGMKHLKGLKGLKQLDLANTTVTDAGLAQIKRLTGLQFLGLYATKVTDTGLKSLTSLKNLQFLGLYGTKVSDEGVAKLKKSLRNCTISR